MVAQHFSTVTRCPLRENYGFKHSFYCFRSSFWLFGTVRLVHRDIYGHPIGPVLAGIQQGECTTARQRNCHSVVDALHDLRFSLAVFYKDRSATAHPIGFCWKYSFLPHAQHRLFIADSNSAPSGPTMAVAQAPRFSRRKSPNHRAYTESGQ